ncbi:hypothetical protein [Pengzhenrongella sicca]|uniref:Uncharacterized protein n=1 Tax=Pengzhenrongella sicca TaxID=2819238 RepID=A0A8A4ZJ22_9MICO|nr:hypothetical protein [Pengzhenrongella sicca]QTE31033.1 hypothetical protein J4E96_08985 [Pengzhenrongella sicca]
MESDASRASTAGVPVGDHRWANKDELVMGALTHYRNRHRVEIPGTGALRGHLLAALTGMGASGAACFAIAAASALSGLLAGIGRTPAEVRDQIIGDQRLSHKRAIEQRARDGLDDVPR